jgi:putative inorganic carbon (HCO3(-)) transporter
MTTLEAVTFRFSPRERFIALLFGLPTGVFMIYAAAQTPKWFFFLFFSLFAAAFLVIIPVREKFLIYLTIVLMTVSLDFHPVFLESATTPWPVSGWRISLFEITFLILLLIWMIRLVLKRLYPIQFFPLISVPFGLLWILGMVGIVRADLPLVIKFCTAWLVAESWLIFIYFANQLRDRRLLMAVVTALLLSGALQSLLGLGQYLSGGTLGLGFFGEAKTFMEMRAGDFLVSRVSGTFGHPNNLAGYLSMILQLNLALLFAPLRRRLKVGLFILLVLMAIALVLSLSRGGWLAFVLGGLATIFLCLSRRSRNKAVSLVLALTLAIIFLMSSVILVEPLKRRLFEEDYGAAQTRVPLTLVALNVIRHRPWLGVGLTNYVAAAPSYDITREAISFEFPRPVHNEFLLIGAELGLPALALVIFILGVLWRQLFRASQNPEETPLPYVALGLLGAFVAWVGFRLTDYHYVLLADPFWVYAGLAQALTGTLATGLVKSTTPTTALAHDGRCSAR